MSHIDIYNGSSVGDADIVNLILSIIRNTENTEEQEGISITTAKSADGKRVHVFTELIEKGKCFTVVDSEVAEADMQRLAEEGEQDDT